MSCSTSYLLVQFDVARTDKYKVNVAMKNNLLCHYVCRNPITEHVAHIEQNEKI